LHGFGFVSVFNDARAVVVPSYFQDFLHPMQFRVVSLVALPRKETQRLEAKDRFCRFPTRPLLVGTLCFLVLCFLLPTTAVYYLFFLTFRVGTRAVIIFLQMLVVLLTRVPLYYLVLYFRKSPLLSGGIRFELCQNRMLKRSSQTLLYLKLKTNPKLSIGAFFTELFQYFKEVNLSL